MRMHPSTYTEEYFTLTNKPSMSQFYQTLYFFALQFSLLSLSVRKIGKVCFPWNDETKQQKN